MMCKAYLPRFWNLAAADKRKIDDVLGVWPLHGLCGAWGGVAAGIFGAKALGGIAASAWLRRPIGTLGGVAFAALGSLVVYGSLRRAVGMRLDAEAAFNGADLSIHTVSATAERETNW